MNAVILPIIYNWLLSNSLLLIGLIALIFGAYQYYNSFLAIRREVDIDVTARYLRLQMYRRYGRQMNRE